ncbi:hydrolase [Amylibacter marinus]|uniref:Hydrolase n=1 Tax=Amylibacter marinus TaxID=1475483 RepID=A0ABQ5VW39_9RHOB|nr:HAD hydrolase-like protein [Amylibacter marinus]GLQ35359.1 hydrolase [Amylibacter marinus]
MLNLFFDLDGTLIDPQEGITNCVQHTLRELGADVPDAAELTWMIGPPLGHGFMHLLQDPDLAMQAVEIYRERYAEEGMFEADIYDGVGEMFDQLHQIDARLFIATSKPLVFAQEVVGHFGLHAHIEQLFGSELDGTRADKTELLQHALDETGIDPAQAIMIGDREFDIFGAKNNDIPNIAALWGFGDAEELRRAEPDMMAGHPEEVLEIAADMMGLEI